MILLILVAALWVVVLTPSVWRRIKERGGVVSIDHFHHQLKLLEHAGPKLVSPAYRLHSAGADPSLDVASARPKLVLLREVEDGQSADIEDVDGSQYARVGVIQSPQPSLSPAQTQTGLAAHRRQQARQRCTFLLRLLAAAAIGSGIIGLLPAMRLAWIFTGVTGFGALALVGLVAYAREVAGQRRPRIRAAEQYRYEQPLYADLPQAEPSPEVEFFDAAPRDREAWDEEAWPSGAAQAGFPGAWDEDEEWDEEPLRRASGGR